MTLEAQMRTAIRDAVNRASRKPFYWGGLVGYQQLEAIGQALHRVPGEEAETAYLHQIASQVDRAVEQNRPLAQDVAKAHTQLRSIADCLQYPPDLSSASTTPITATSLTGQQVRDKMEKLLRQFQPDLKRQPAQATLYRTWHRLWRTCGPDVLYCYDIPGLPPDNLKLEALFGQLRRNQRRISGRKSTAELRDFGQYQVLFVAQSEDELLQQLRQVPVADYQVHRHRLAEAEAPRQLLRRLHHDPVSTMNGLVNQHAARRAELTHNPAVPSFRNTS